MIREKAEMIRTERLCLRRMVDRDRDRVLGLITNKEIAKTYMLPDFTSTDEAVMLFERLKGLSNNSDRFVYGIALGEEIIGFINEVEKAGREIELGFAIHPDHHNRGYATEVLVAATKALFDMGYDRVKTGAFEENIASQRVMEKAGMVRLAETERIEYRGITHNCVMFEKTK